MDSRPVAGIIREGWGGGAYLKNRDQIITVGMVSHASSDLKTQLVLGGGGGRGHAPSDRNILKFQVLNLLEMQ